MSARAHRLALWLRLLVVCLMLTGVSAPARTMGYREAVVAIATATTRAPQQERKATPPLRAARSAPAAQPWITAWSPRLAAPAAPELAPAPPRRIFLINSALLC
jgi:hypothetical protein